MYYSPDVIEEIRMRNDIVDVIGSYVSLKQKGKYYFGLCPFHNESTPSFSVSPDSQIYYCFGCNAGGNIYSFIMQMENLTFPEAVRFLAERINYNLPEESYSEEAKKNRELKAALYEINVKAARYFYANLQSKEGEKAVKYLDNRQVKPSVRKKYGLGFSVFKRDFLFNTLSKEGYDLDILLKSGLVIQDSNGGYRDRFINRLMFPIIDVHGKIVGFGGRILENGEPKYLNSPDTLLFNKSQNLYSINFAKASRTKEFILVEGYMDVISLYQAGFKNAVAALGTAFNNEHAKLLKKYADSVIVLFDSDEAGTRAALRAIEVLKENGIKGKVLQVKDAKDPDEYIKKFGAEAFFNLLNTAKSYILFKIEKEAEKYDLSKIEDKISFTNVVADILSKISNSIEQEAYLKEIARLTDISEESIKNEIVKLTDKFEVNLNNKKYNKPKYATNSQGIDEARKFILKVLIKNNYIYSKVKEVLKPEEFIEQLYVKLAFLIDKFYEEKKTLYPAELINYFESIDEQNAVSRIFMENMDIENENFEKLLNDQLKQIKLAYINHEISSVKDVLEIQNYIKEKRKIDSLNITLSDG